MAFEHPLSDPVSDLAKLALPFLLLDIVLLVGTVFLLWRRNPIGYLGAWIFLILSPTFLVPIVTEAAADRRMYLPLASLVILVFIGGYALVQRFVPMLASTDAQKPHRAAAISLLSVGFVLAIVLGTVERNSAAGFQRRLNALARDRRQPTERLLGNY